MVDCHELINGPKNSEAKESTNPRNNTNFESANIVTCSRDDNTCVAIFKNPLDRKTHFYRTRLRGNVHNYYILKVA